MKKFILILMAAVLILTCTACAEEEAGDLTSINDYIAPSYTYKLDIEGSDIYGTITFAEGVGDTAIIADYVGPYTAHEIVVPNVIDERIVVEIGKEAFYYCTAATSIVIPDTVTAIGDWAFAGCVNLETIVIPASVTSIGKGAFNGCEKLKSVVFMGTALKSIGDFAFNDCAALAEISLPEGLEDLGIQAFRGCNVLASVKTPETLKTIGDMAFYGCEGLNADGALTLTSSIEKIGEFAFTGINKKYIKAPEGSFAAKYVSEMRETEEPETEAVSETESATEAATAE